MSMGESGSEKDTDLGKKFLEDSITDLEISVQLSQRTDSGSKRRRLYLLQQAFEKGIKSMMPEIAMNMMLIPYFSSLRLVKLTPKGMTGVPERPLEIVMRRGEKIFTGFQRPKELTHNPAKQLEIKRFLEDCYLFSMAVENVEWAETCLRCIHFIERDDIKVILNEIDSHWKSLEDIRSRASDLKLSKPISLSKPQADLLFRSLSEFSELDVKLSCLYLSLSALLARYEQSARYPGSTEIPVEMFDSLDRIQRVVQNVVQKTKDSHAEELFDLKKFLLEYGRPWWKTM